MRDLPFFRGDIRDLSLKKGWEARISVASESGIPCFYRGRMRDWQGKQSGTRDFSVTQKRKLAKMNPSCV